MQEKNLLTACIYNLKILSMKVPLYPEIIQFMNKKSNINEVILPHIIYYLLSTISLNKAVEFLPWPLQIFKTRLLFRIGVNKFIIWINNEWPEARIRYVPSLLLSPVREINLLRFILKLSLFTLKISARRDEIAVGYIIPEILSPHYKNSEKLLIYQNKAKTALHSFRIEKTKLDEQLNIKRKELRKFKKANDLLKNCLGVTTNNLISLCPIKYQTRLVSNDGWKSAIIEWTKEVDELSEVNECKRKIVEALYNSFCNLSGFKITCNNSNHILDAEEIFNQLSTRNQTILEDVASEIEVSLFIEKKLSLPGLLKVCEKVSSNILCYLENRPPLFNNLSTMQNNILNKLKKLNKHFADYHTKLSDLESKLRPKYSELVHQILDGSQEQLSSRRLSNFFKSPVISITQDFRKSSISSPGISGEHLLEEDKKKFRKLLEEGVENDIETTPVLKKEFLSSTMRSGSSRKNLRVLVESSSAASLSPIEGSSREAVNIEKKNLNSDGGSLEPSVDTFFSPLKSDRHSLSIKNTKLLSSDLNKKTMRVLSPFRGSVLKIVSDESLIIDKDTDSDSSPELFKSPIANSDQLKFFSTEPKKNCPSLKMIIEKYINLEK